MGEKKTSKESPEKKRHWCFVLYPESAPVDWVDLLQKTGLLCAASPLHDKDFENDEIKKAHHHIILSYPGPTTYNIVASLTKSLNATIPQKLESVRGQYRYFSHKDSPDKYQYNEDEIILINGFNIGDFVELTRSEVAIMKRRLQSLIIDLNLLEYSDFMDYMLENGTNDEYDVGSNNTYFFDRYISSRRNKGSIKTK